MVPAWKVPDTAGCSASATSTLTTALYFTLASDCGYGGTFSFQVPGDYLAPNPTGDVSVTLSIGVNTLKTVITFIGPNCLLPFFAVRRAIFVFGFF